MEIYGTSIMIQFHALHPVNPILQSQKLFCEPAHQLTTLTLTGRNNKTQYTRPRYQSRPISETDRSVIEVLRWSPEISREDKLCNDCERDG